MLRVEMHDGNGTLIMRLYGRLSGEYAADIRKLLTRCNPKTRLVVDLTEVTFVDAAGEEVLSSFGREHGAFIAENVYAKSLCERLRLPLVRSRRRKRDRSTAAVESSLD
jgi:STAS domain-containing protein